MSLSAISHLLSSLNAAKDIALAMISEPDAQAVQYKLVEFQGKLLDAHNYAFAAQEERMALLAQVSLLKEEVAHLKAWGVQKERYELQKIPSFHKSFAYALKPDSQGDEPPHYICANCYENGKRSILQPLAKGGAKYLICHGCGAELVLDGSMPTSPQSARPAAYDPQPI